MAAVSDDNSPDPSIAELIAARPHLRLHAMDGLLMEDAPLNRIADATGTPTRPGSIPPARRGLAIAR